MYQALYRKYRPSTFSDVSGQPHITITLKNQLKLGRIFHAYLFTGTRGTGKTSCAKILSKAVNCLNSNNGEPCDKCENCISIKNETNLDILEIDAASNNGVDHIRDLRENAVFTPTTSKYRVYIIDEVHMLSSSAFNALLKTLEEPPAHVVFILATTEAHKLPATILSRCQRFDFKRIEAEDISNRLLFVSKNEGFELTEDAAMLIASLSDGGMRDALSVLDLCAGHSAEINEETVEQVCGLAGRDYLIELSGYIGAGDIEGALNLLDKLHHLSVDMQRLCNELISHFRNLMLIKTVKNANKLIVSTKTDFEKLKLQAADFLLESIMNTLRILEDTLERISGGNRRTEMEMAIVKLCSPRFDTKTDAILERLTKLENIVKNGNFESVKTPVKKEKPKAVTEDDNKPKQPLKGSVIGETAPTGSETSFGEWSEVLSVLAKSCPLIFGVLQGSTAYIKDDILFIDALNSQFRDLVSGSSNIYRDEIRKAAEAVTGNVYRLGPYKKPKQKNDALEDPFEKFIDKIEELKIPRD